MKTLVRMSAAAVAAFGLLVAPAGAAVAQDNGRDDPPRASALGSLTDQQRADVLAARQAFRTAVADARSAYRTAVAPIKDQIRTATAGQAAAVKAAKENLRAAYQGTDDAARSAARDELRKAVDD